MLATVDQLNLLQLRQFPDPRGVLVPMEFGELVPFPVVRVFWVKDVPPETKRGGHAHKLCEQFLIAAAGNITVDVFDGRESKSFLLSEGTALHVPSGIFAAETFHAAHSLLLVLCSRPYEAGDYLADHESLARFRAAAVAQPGAAT